MHESAGALGLKILACILLSFTLFDLRNAQCRSSGKRTGALDQTVSGVVVLLTRRSDKPDRGLDHLLCPKMVAQE